MFPRFAIHDLLVVILRDRNYTFVCRRGRWMCDCKFRRGEARPGSAVYAERLTRRLPSTPAANFNSALLCRGPVLLAIFPALLPFPETRRAAAHGLGESVQKLEWEERSSRSTILPAKGHLAARRFPPRPGKHRRKMQNSPRFLPSCLISAESGDKVVPIMFLELPPRPPLSRSEVPAL